MIECIKHCLVLATFYLLDVLDGNEKGAVFDAEEVVFINISGATDVDVPPVVGTCCE